jgi:thiol-disulfide isomerase/thioredoxin
MDFLRLSIISFFISATFSSFAQKIEEIPNFTLKDVISGKNISLYSYKGKKATVVIFTSNYCPYSKLYEQRIKDLVSEYESIGVGFMMINSNNSALSQDESITIMIMKAKESDFNLPYLADKELIAKKIFQAEKTPEAFVLTEAKGGLSVVYRGAIDDNPQSPNEVKDNYIKLALDNLISGKVSPVTSVRPTGCRIKTE